MHLQHVCLSCLRHGRHFAQPSRTTALWASRTIAPVALNPIPNTSPPFDWSHTSGRRYASAATKTRRAKVRRIITFSGKHAIPKLAAQLDMLMARRTRRKATPSSQSPDSSSAAPRDKHFGSVKGGEFRNALLRFNSLLSANVARELKTDPTADSRKLRDVDIEELIKTAAVSNSGEEQTEVLRCSLRALLQPLQDLKTATTLRLLHPYGKPESPQDVASALFFDIAALQAGNSRAENPGRIAPEKRSTTPQLIRRPLSGPYLGQTEDGAGSTEINDSQSGQLNIAELDPQSAQTLRTAETSLKPVFDEDIEVRNLSFDLSRVLFNPGVYQLQDPRSRVYNFDPYLEKIMPVTEFDFEALNEYVTSSEDDKLRQLALQSDNRYIGSSSSMTSTLAQFHFLISAWRSVSFANLTKGFKAESHNFTRLTRSPSAVFLRWRDGVYAMDADKEFDSANILMSLGKSIEKLLTLEKDDFEKYRKSARGEANPEAEKPEQYHYGKIGKFLMRSQLDAYDPRLPGTGMFDLKTRAVAAVRMSLSDHERGQGYQIKGRFGTWESYEREYYDMIRSAMLKYSLQVRMGRMDGIFVAFHNIERIFGFQYISLPEMDEALHGQSDASVGDREFGFSVKIMEDIFDRATKKFPEQTLRIYVETREPTPKMEPVAYMNVFAEAVTEEEVEKIQQASKVQMEAFEQRIFNGLDPYADEATQDAEDASVGDDSIETSEPELRVQGTPTGSPTSNSGTKDPSANDADVHFLDRLSKIDLPVTDQSLPDKDLPQGGSPTSSVVGFRVTVRNTVNGKAVPRVQELKQEDDWQLDYSIEEIPAVHAGPRYRLCKARRTRALKLAMSRGDEPDYFLASLLRLSEAGREWRRQQDELDAQRQTVVLYDTGNGAAGPGTNVQ